MKSRMAGRSVAALLTVALPGLVGADPAPAPAPPIAVAAALLTEVERRFGKEARLLSLELGTEEATVTVQDPAEPSHVDRYTYQDGALKDPEPVAVGRSQRSLRARLFDATEVRASVLPTLIEAAPVLVDTDQGRVIQVILERAERSSDTGSSWGPPRWRVLVDGPRGGGYVEYALDGKKKDVKRW
jgi:hypothetical protein